MKKFGTILSKITYFYKLAQSASVGMYDEIMRKAQEASQLGYSDLAIEIALIADLYRIAVKNNSGFSVIAKAINNCFDNSLDIDEGDDFEAFLNSVYADISNKVTGDVLNAPIDNETKSAMTSVKSKINFIGTEDLLRRIQGIVSGMQDPDDEIEEESEDDLSKYDDRAVSKLNLNEGLSKEDGGNSGYEVSGVKTYKNWIDEFKNEKIRYTSMIPTATDTTKRNIMLLFALNDKLLENRTKLLDLKTDVSNPNQDRNKIDLELLGEDEDMIRLRKEVAALKRLHSSPESAAKLAKHPKVLELAMMEQNNKLIQDTLKNRKQTEETLESETPELLEDIKKLQKEGKILQDEKNRKKNSIRIYDRLKNIELLNMELKETSNPMRKFLIEQKIELEKTNADRKHINKTEETRYRKQLIALLENALSDKPKGEALTPEKIQSLLEAIEIGKTKKVDLYSKEVEIANEKRELINTGLKAKTNRVVTSESLKGLVKHLSGKIADGKTIAKQTVLDPIVKSAKEEIYNAEHTAFAPYLAKIAEAHKLQSKSLMTEAIKELSKVMSKYIESQPKVVEYIQSSASLYEVRDSFKKLADSNVFDSEISDETKNKIHQICATAISTIEHLRELDFPKVPLNAALEIALLLQEQVE